MNYKDELIFSAKYPFTREAKAKIETVGIDFSKVNEELLTMAFQRVKSAERGNRRLANIESSGESNLMNEIISFPLAKILAAMSGDFVTKKQLANAESRDVYMFLQLDSDANAMTVASQLFELQRDGDHFLIPLKQYANNVPEGPEYKLVNSEVSGGLVRITKEALAKLVSKYAMNSVLDTKVDPEIMPPIFKSFAAELASMKQDVDFGPVSAENFPPCIRKVILELEAGGKVGHYPRFALSTFFANISLPPEKAVDYFRNQPNFNEKLTIYHLHHATGDKGGKKYSMPSCATLESYGACRRDDSCKWSHPLTYYRNMKGRK